MANPFQCEQCGGELESDDAISVIEGVCCPCRMGDRVTDGHPPSAISHPSDHGLADILSAERAAETAPDDEGPTKSSSQNCNTGHCVTGVPPMSPNSCGIGVSPVLHHEPDARVTGSSERGSEDSQSDTSDSARFNGCDILRPPPAVMPAQTINSPRSKQARRRSRDLAIGTVLGLIITAVIVGYFLTQEAELQGPAMLQTPSACSVTLRLQPAWAVVKLDDEEIGPAGESGKLALSLPLDGEAIHWLEVSADGYHTDRRPVSAVGGVDDVFIELVRKPYDVAIRTDPPQAEVWINDKLKGHSPLSVSLLPDERATLTVRHQGYVALTQTLSPPPRGGRLDLDLALQAAGPMLRVESHPPGAEVALDGAVQGSAPLTLTLDPSYLGKDVAIAASTAGYKDTTTLVTLPEVGRDEVTMVQLTLNQALAEVVLWTTPPGGQIIIDGKDMGRAPVTAEFEPSETGKQVVVQASLAGSYYGRQEVIVPSTNESPIQVTIPMEFNAQRVAFLLSLPADMRVDSALLTDRAIELIHQLTPQQRFSVLVQTDEGIESWPGGQGTEAATSEQKVRAYDMIRSVRRSTADNVMEMLRASLGFRPTTIWLFAAGELDRDALLQFSDWAEGHDVSVHVVQTAVAEKQDWLKDWTTGHHGTLTIIGRDRLPVLAFEDHHEDSP